MTAWAALKPVDGAGIWRTTAPHTETRWTLLGALFVGALCGLALAVLYFGGQRVVCWSDKAMTGKVAHSYCSGWVAPTAVQP